MIFHYLLSQNHSDVLKSLIAELQDAVSTGVFTDNLKQSDIDLGVTGFENVDASTAAVVSGLLTFVPSAAPQSKSSDINNSGGLSSTD